MHGKSLSNEHGFTWIMVAVEYLPWKQASLLHNQFMNRNRKHVAEYLPFYEKIYEDHGGCFPMEESENIMKKNMEDSSEGKQINYVIVHKDEMIGICGIIRIHEKKGELGYLLDKEFVGKGICTISAKWVLQNAFKESLVCQVLAVIQNENKKSIEVVKRLGFEFLESKELQVVYEYSQN